MKLLRINMESCETKEELLHNEYALLGGRALSSRMVNDEVDAASEPLGPKNKLVFTTGYLAGTVVSCANRLSVGAKSPLTGGIKESNSGGIAAYKMGKLGIRAIMVEGFREDAAWYVLVINKEGACLKESKELLGKGINEKAALLYEQYGAQVGMILIGPAGEKRLLSAGIASNDTDGIARRFCGRGGLGAVMGAKHLLAIVLDDTGCQLQQPSKAELFKSKVKEFNELLLTNPQTSQVFPKYGTAAMMEITDALGGLPTRNFSHGRFTGASRINGEAVYNTILSRGGEGTTTHACMPGCLVRCSNVFPDKDGNRIVTPLEYETLGLMGSNLEIDDLDTIARLNYICNDYGIDTIETGCAIGVAMEAGIIPFGDKVGVVRLVNEIVNDTYLGKILAAGCVTTAKVLGVRRVPAVKGQGMAAYEPRAIKGTGVTYITSAMGADHTAGNLARAAIKHHLKDGQVEASKRAQLGMSIIDSLGFCMMVAPAVKERRIFVELINAFYGWSLTEAQLEAIGAENLAVEAGFNTKAGFTAYHDRLPEHFYHEPNPATGTVFDIHQEDIVKDVG